MDIIERRAEIPVDIVTQRFQRRHVHDRGDIVELARNRIVHEGVDCAQKCSKGFAGAGRRRDECVPARADRRPGLRLRRGWGGEMLLEPVRDYGMETCVHDV